MWGRRIALLSGAELSYISYEFFEIFFIKCFYLFEIMSVFIKFFSNKLLLHFLQFENEGKTYSKKVVKIILNNEEIYYFYNNFSVEIKR